MDFLKDISFDVRQLISINDKIQSRRLRGTVLNHDEAEIVRHCASELLNLTKKIGHRRDWRESGCSSTSGSL